MRARPCPSTRPLRTSPGSKRSSSTPANGPCRGTGECRRARDASTALGLMACTAWIVLAANGAHAQDPGTLPEWTVGPGASVSIGVSGGGPGHLLDRVAGATRLTDGTIVVANGGGSELRFFAPDGTHLRSQGRRGQGPGEYQAMHALLRLAGDTLLVVSRSPGLTWVSPEGEYVRSLAVNLSGRDRHPCRRSEGPTYGLDRRLVKGADEEAGSPGCGAAADGISRLNTLVELQDHEAERFDTVTVLPGTERNGRAWRVFGGVTLIAAGSGRIFAADSRSDTIHVFEGARPAGTWTTPLRAERVPPSARRERFETPRYSDGRVERRDYDYPDAYPAMGRLLADATGGLWVMRYPSGDRPLYSVFLTGLAGGFQVEGGGARWVVHDASGAPVARARTPDGFFPLEIGADYVLGVSRDALDLQSVELYPLRRR